MNKQASKRSVVTSVRVPIELRSQLEHLKLARAQRGYRLPRLRDLVLEGIALLVEAEAKLVGAANDASATV